MNQFPRRHPARATARALLVTAAVSLLLGAAGCVYRINVQQGNFLDQKAIDQVTPGMNRSQVRLLLGTPMVGSAFDTDRWDYVYYVKIGKTRRTSSRKVTVFFDGDKVTRVEHPDGPENRVAKDAGPAPATAPAATPTQSQ